jgi:hypothetical protein
MVGRTCRLLEELKATRGRDAAGLHFLRTHLILKGINPDAHSPTSEDDPSVVAELERMVAGGVLQKPQGMGRS